jgi:hypothetical protein
VLQKQSFFFEWGETQLKTDSLSERTGRLPSLFWRWWTIRLWTCGLDVLDGILLPSDAQSKELNSNAIQFNGWSVFLGEQIAERIGMPREISHKYRENYFKFRRSLLGLLQQFPTE